MIPCQAVGYPSSRKASAHGLFSKPQAVGFQILCNFPLEYNTTKGARHALPQSNMTYVIPLSYTGEGGRG